MSALMLMGLLACGSESSLTFPGGGSSGPSDDTAEDTGGPEFGDADAPVITELAAIFEYYPTIGWVIECEATYTDPDADLEGGMVHMTLTSTSGELVDSVVIDGTYVFIDEASVMWAIDGVETSTVYTLTVNLEDTAGHWSETMTAQVSG
jgi:hypothetical protein